MVIDKDLGWGRIKKDIKNLKESYTKVGVQSGTVYKPTTKGSGRKGGEDMLKVAYANEFGDDTRNIPERSFLRSAYDGSKEALNTLIADVYYKIISGELSIQKGLGLVGEFLEARTKRKFVTGNFLPNAPSTVERKKSSRPLIDTGQLRNSIKHVEEIKGK